MCRLSYRPIMSQRIFISYATDDTDKVERVVASLERSGLHCWIAPRDIDPGVPYAQSIINAISKCAAFVIFFSKSSNESPYVLSEVDSAMKRKRHIIPFMLDKSEMSAVMEFYLGPKQWIIGYNDLDDAAGDLGDFLRETLGIKAKKTVTGPAVTDMVNKDDGDSSGKDSRMTVTVGDFSFDMIGINSEFMLGEFPVTQNLWTLVMDSNPSRFQQSEWKSDSKGGTGAAVGAAIGSIFGPVGTAVGGIIGHAIGRENGPEDDTPRYNLPVENITRVEAEEFCRLLSALSGIEFRLPTVNEWLSAAVADGRPKSGYWARESAEGMTHPVGRNSAGELGLFDLYGNVFEWTSTVDDKGRGALCGGCWWLGALDCLTANPRYADPTSRSDGYGMRLAATIPKKKSISK